MQTDIEAPGPAGPLRGTLLSPATGDVPVVLIVPGSGPTDRNGNNPYGIQASIYRLLAEGLLGQGIASVRIDKRGMYGSASAIADADDVTIDDYAADVRAWVAAIRARTGARRVRARLTIVANANHVLKTVHTDARDENLAAYSHPDLPLASGVVEAISAFVRESTGGGMGRPALSQRKNAR